MTHVNYKELAAVIASLTEGETDAVALMATVACEVHHSDDRFNWTGFYRVTEPGVLKIGPYQGGHGCLVIPLNKGVCGACARTGEPQLVGNVNAIDDHIACSASTQSEIVLPVVQDGRLIGVLDIDSDKPALFDDEDRAALEDLVGRIFG